MLTGKITARTTVCHNHRQLKSRRKLVACAQENKEPGFKLSFGCKVAPVLLSAGLALNLLLATPHVAEARVRANLQQQREEQERLYAEQLKKLDAILEQQIKAKQAEGGAKSTPETGASPKAGGGTGKQSR